MTRLALAFRLLADLLFHGFLAAYWYLVHSLPAHYAALGALASLVIYRLLRPRVPLTSPVVLWLVSAALLFFLMLNPLPNLRGVALLLWFTACTLAFRLCFAALGSLKLKGGALAVSYILFLLLPLGLPRLWSIEPTVAADRPLDVAVVGAGFGGIAIGKELLDSGITNFQIYEAAPEVGGTWWHNRYPGLHVDVRSSLYSYSTFPNPNWSRSWAPRKELLEYAIQASEAFGVRPFIRLSTWVEGLQFDEQSGLWQLTVGGKPVLARHVVLATGGLHIPNTPQFTGADTFKGTTFHSARWRDDVELAGKRIAIIGSGASAVQVIPEIAKIAAQVDMYQRTPNWVSPQDNREISTVRQKVYRYVPMAYKLERLRTYVFSELGFRAVFPMESTRRAQVEQALGRYVNATIDDKELAAKLIPDYEFGCKRPLITGHFYPSLNRPNVGVITEGIDRLTPSGIRSRANIERDYDVIIMATGFRLAELPFPVTGREDQSLAELWRDQPEAYESMMVHGYPNLYLMSGPNSGLIGSIIIHIESAANFMVQVIEKAGDAGLIEPRLEAQQAYNTALQENLQQTVWAGSCKSWYKLDSGHVVANNPHPISMIVYDRMQPRWEDFLFSERP